ncbi:hypothetical protein M9H77_00627 [Catharanthus roseus]|nr:hypothetical protein M9H77_00627 [Catharanthus roseus]
MNGDDGVTSTTGVAKNATVDGGGNGGLVISTTEIMHSFLRTASVNPDLSQDLRDLASSLTQQTTVPYKSLKSIWVGCDPKSRPNILCLFSGSSFVFTSPKPREKAEEISGSRREKAYEELVKDITPSKSVEEPFSSYKDQIGFGLHVVLIMFTGYLVGYAAFRALFGHSPAMAAAGGILGLVFGMLVETLLFIIRTTSQDRQPSSFTSRIKKDQYFATKLKKDQ